MWWCCCSWYRRHRELARTTASSPPKLAYRGMTRSFFAVDVAETPTHSTRPHRQEFLVDNNVEVRGSSLLNRSAFVGILERMFKGCTEAPTPPPLLTEDIKRRREAVALVRACCGGRCKIGLESMASLVLLVPLYLQLSSSTSMFSRGSKCWTQVCSSIPVGTPVDSSESNSQNGTCPLRCRFCTMCRRRNTRTQFCEPCFRRLSPSQGALFVVGSHNAESEGHIVWGRYENSVRALFHPEITRGQLQIA